MKLGNKSDLSGSSCFNIELIVNDIINEFDQFTV